MTATEPKPRLVVDHLHKAYRATKARWGKKITVSQTVAIDDISFQVQPGEVVSLLGPSGCGKTTLLRIVAGLATADSGRVSVDGRRIHGPSKERALVFQHFGLLPWRNVLDNVAFPLELDGVSEAERYETARKYLHMVGLNGFENHFPHGLSGGMQQRVGIARALTRQPLLLLMDEPFGALDAQTREVLQDEMLRILAMTRNTVVFVTHSIGEALLISNRILVFTPSPGQIKRVIDVPRRLADAKDIRSNAEFKELEQEIRELLRRDIHV